MQLPKNQKRFPERILSTLYPYNIGDDSMNQVQSFPIRQHLCANALSYHTDEAPDLRHVEYQAGQSKPVSA